MNLQELIKLCERSDRGAQRELFALYKDAMMNICVRYAKNESQASEILKEGFATAFGLLKKVDELDFENWLKKIMIDSAIRVLRRYKQDYKIVSTVNAYEGLSRYNDFVDDTVTREIEAGDVINAIQLLSPSYRIVVNMHLADGYSLKQISEKMEVGEPTIRLNFERAMHQLRKNIVQLTTISNAE